MERGRRRRRSSGFQNTERNDPAARKTVAAGVRWKVSATTTWIEGRLIEDDRMTRRPTNDSDRPISLRPHRKYYGPNQKPSGLLAVSVSAPDPRSSLADCHHPVALAMAGGQEAQLQLLATKRLAISMASAPGSRTGCAT
jgi:hypothetical protein